MSIMRKHVRTFMIASISALMSATGGLAVQAHAQTEATVTEAGGVDAPDVFISELVDKLRIIAARDDNDAAKSEELRLVLADDIATKRLQYFLLSKSQRAELSEDDIARYDAVFPKYITSAFAASIDDLVKREVKINDVVERRPGDYIVRSKLYSDDGEARANLDWRLLESKGDKQLVDVMIDGLSFNVERRAQFTSILKADGFEALISHMDEVAAGDDTDDGNG